MKLKLKLFFALLISVTFIYTACQKTATNPTGPTLTAQAVTSQVALNLSQSLFGGLGAFDVSGGLSAPTTFAVHTKGKVLQSLTNPFCGLTVDTTVNYSASVGDSTATVSGSFKFAFSCTNDVLSGYTTNDNLNISLVSPTLSFTYKVGEDITLLSINPQSNTSNLSLNGTLNSNGAYVYKTTSKSGTSVFNYTLKSLVIDPNAGDIVSGSATFTTQGSGSNGVWNFSGTIAFLGNSLATVTINGKTYNVNLQTGVVS